ncbi:MAG: hypothetical protein IJY65_02035 [Clostridia bacterium]|nr:hypothetical protein [Clostridia bacterium]
MQNIKNKKKLIIAIVAAVVAIAVIAVAVVGIVSMISGSQKFDYTRENLSRYINISPSLYEKFDISISIDGVTEDDVDNYINGILCDNKESKPLYNGAGTTNQPISVGDVVNIYYRGYTVDEFGNEIDFDGGTNISDATTSELEIGSNSFVSGFELGLIGKNPKDYEKFEKITDGTVLDGQVVYITYSAISANQSAISEKTGRVDLNSDVDAIWGEGFADYLKGREVGSTIEDPKTFERGDDSVIYYDVKINFVTECEKNPLTVSAYFPYDYSSSETLRCKEVFFDVYVESVVLYEAPDLTDEFITETLKITADDLAEFEGDTLVEKYRESVRAKLTEDYEADYDAAVEEKIWEILNKGVTVTEYPTSAVNEQYREYYDDLAAQYASYSSYYSTIEEFAVAYFGLEDKDYEGYMKEQARAVVKEKLTFFYIARAEGLLPNAEELTAERDRYIDEYVDYYVESDATYDREKFDSDEEYEAAIAELRENLISYYGMEYFDEVVYYERVVEELLSRATVKVTSGRGHDK